MIVSDSHRFIFIHNPKCAGTSVRRCLSQYDTLGSKFWRKVDHRLPRKDMAHMEMQYIYDFYPEIWEKMQSYFVFGFCRHPMRRLVSGFNETHKALYKEAVEYPESLATYRCVFNAYCQRFLRETIDNFPFTHTLPQHRMFYQGNKCRADLVLKIEEFSETSLIRMFPFIDERVCSDLAKAIHAKNRMNVKEFPLQAAQLLDDVVLENVYQYYKRDFQIFGYQQDVRLSREC